MFMYILLAVVLLALVLYIVKLKSETASDRQDGITLKYQYRAKPYVMTQAEATFFKRLEQITREKYYVFPQIHLNDILDHKIPGQNWRDALQTIQRKSVDFVLVDKQTMKTTYAVELDDSTHDSPKRQERDNRVEAMMKQANISLVRFRNIDTLSDQDIVSALSAHYTPQE